MSWQILQVGINQQGGCPINRENYLSANPSSPGCSANKKNFAYDPKFVEGTLQVVSEGRMNSLGESFDLRTFRATSD